MSDVSLDGGVNQHYLNKVMDLAEVMPVVATEDIYDARGTKLLAKGSRVSTKLQEKLILHKLKKPIETSLIVEGGVDSRLLGETAKRLIDTNTSLANILQATCANGFTPVTALSNMVFGNALSMMLTISERDGSQAFDHAVTVSMLSICMAKKLGVSESDLKVAGIAGLLHDIGELYINPIYLARGKRLEPHEWGHIVVHPRIGQMLISECDSLPPGVGQAVAEHHERFDGSGYPRQLSGKQISVPGQIVAMAEMLAGLLQTNRPLERAELALKVFATEHSHALLSVIASALRFSQLALGSAASETIIPARPGEDPNHLYERITASMDMVQALSQGPAGKSPVGKDLLELSTDRIRGIQRAFISTGMDAYLSQSSIVIDTSDSAIMFEKEVATGEIQWRLRGVARDVALRSGAKDDTSIYAELIHLLDNTTSTGAMEKRVEVVEASNAE